MTIPKALNVDDIDLSNLEFWEEPWSEREAAFATLRAERPIAFFEEPEIEVETIVPIPPGPGYYAITRYADVVEISRHPELYCSGQSATIDLRHAAGAPRVLRLDDQHGRPPPRPAAPDRVGRLQPPHGARRRGQHRAGGRRHHRQGARQGRVRLRHRGGGPAAAEGHLRHDGRARERLRHRLQPVQHHPVLRRHRVRPRGRGPGDSPS